MAQSWLIRHGQSEANAGLRSSSAARIALTPLGRQQTEAVARSFTEPPKRIVHSPYARAEQSCAATCSRFANVPVECWPVQEFTYLAAARCHDTTSAERLPLVQEYWARADPDFVDGEGAESFRAFIARVDAALARLREPVSTAVFTHGQFMQTCIWRLQVGPRAIDAARMTECRQLMLKTPVPNAAVLELRRVEGSLELGALKTDHLAGLPITY